MYGLGGNSIICSEKELLRTHKIHLEKLLHTKPDLNTKGNEIPNFMKNKLYLKEIIKEKEMKNKYENFIMAQKLYFHSKSPSPYSIVKITPSYCPAFDKRRFNFDKVEKQRSINSQNYFLYKRFFEKKSYYPTKKILKQNDYENYIKNNISRFQGHKPFNGLSLCTYEQFLNKLEKATKNYNRLCSSKSSGRSMRSNNKNFGLNYDTKFLWNRKMNNKFNSISYLDDSKENNRKFINNKMKRSQSAFYPKKI